jgi:hypothetical protein
MRVYHLLLAAGFAFAAFGLNAKGQNIPATATTISVEVSAPTQDASAAEVLKLEQNIGAAIATGDAAYFDRATAEDFVMTHSDRWITGGKPLLVDDKKSFMKRVANHDYTLLELDSVKVVMHGDVAITYGRYIAHMQHVPADREWFAVWFERVYEKRNGQWTYLSHRTVHGATYGTDRADLAGK